MRKTHTRTVIGKNLAKSSKNELGKWRKALKEAANLSGWDLRNTADGHEAKVIKLIVERISLELRSTNMNVEEHLVGMEHRMHDLELSLEIEKNDVRMIGIKGIGGGGKTTLARAIFDKVSIHFEVKCFIENVREVSNTTPSGVKLLQKQVLSDILNDKNLNVSSVHDGTNMMKTRLRGRKILMVLDDVDHKDQLEALAGDPNWFKAGSRIIITTRDEQVLIAHRVGWIHEVSLLSDQEALCLFSRHAFGKDTPIQNYERQSMEVVRYAAGLPLTIKVLGSFLCGKGKPEWIDALARLKTIPLNETLKKLELSYESLEDDYKEMLLDVACLLKGWVKDDAVRMLESCGFHARNGLRVLEQKSLIITSKSVSGVLILDMHDHIEEMGKNIVRRQHPDEPNRHSRLWVQEEVEDILANDLGTEDTRCLTLILTPEIVAIGLENMENMKKLRCLIIDYKSYNGDISNHLNIDEAYQYFPNSLLYINWYGYPHWCLPKTFRANNLVALEMRHSKIEEIWEGRKIMKKLKSVDLYASKLRTFDLELLPNIEWLKLSHCRNLVELHVPVGCLKRLTYLNLTECVNLRSVSFVKQLESLEVLIMHKLNDSREFPDIIPRHTNDCLLALDISWTGIEEVPSSISHLHKLLYLDLSFCTKLKSLPRSICSLHYLRHLDLTVSGIKELPEGLGQLECLVKLDLKCTDIDHLPDSLCMLKNLEKLFLGGCGSLEKLPEDLGQLESLEVLDLEFCYNLRDIPSSICKLRNIKKLNLKQCYQLEELPDDIGLLESLQELIIKDTSIHRLPRSILLLKGLNIIGFESEERIREESSEEDHDGCYNNFNSQSFRF